MAGQQITKGRALGGPLCKLGSGWRAMSESYPEVGKSCPDKCLHVQATLIAKLNLADFQNAVPMLRELSIINDTEQVAKDLELRRWRVGERIATMWEAVFDPRLQAKLREWGRYCATT